MCETKLYFFSQWEEKKRKIFLLLLLHLLLLLLLIIIIIFPLKVFFYTRQSWWSSIGIWVTASLLRSPGLFLVFKPITKIIIIIINNFFNCNQFEMRLLNLIINFPIYCGLFCSHLGSFCVLSSFTTFRPNFTSGLLQKPARIWNHYLLTMLTWKRRDSTPLSAAPRCERRNNTKTTKMRTKCPQ